MALTLSDLPSMAALATALLAASSAAGEKLDVLRQKCDRGGDFTSCVAVATALYYGEGLKRDQREALRRVAALCTADSGNAWACTVHARHTLDERPKEAVENLVWACETRRWSEACLALARLYLDGEYVSRDATQAMYVSSVGCYEEKDESAFDEENPRARANRRAVAECCYMTAAGTAFRTRSIEELSAVSRFKRACNLGLAEGCFEVANIADRGDMVGVDGEVWRQKGLELKRGGVKRPNVSASHRAEQEEQPPTPPWLKKR